MSKIPGGKTLTNTYKQSITEREVGSMKPDLNSFLLYTHSVFVIELYFRAEVLKNSL